MMVAIHDYYKELKLDRSWEQKKLRIEARECYRLWKNRANAANDTEQKLLVEQMKKIANEAVEKFRSIESRKKYDRELDEAYKKGLITDEQEKEFASILEQALEYYRKGDIKLAKQYAKEAIEGKVNDVRAWKVLARCHYDEENYENALHTVDEGLQIYNDDVELNWLGVRIAMFGKQNYDDAQQRINRLIEITPEQSVGHAEQIYLHMTKGNEELAFQEIDQYLEKYPNDNEFRKEMAYNVAQFSDTSYVQDPQTGAYVIADKKSYERCLSIRKKAAEIFQDKFTQKMLEDAQYYGKLEFNEDNKRDLKWMNGVFLYVFVCLVGGTAGGSASPDDLIVLGLLAFALGIPPFILTYVSFRPYWQLNKIYLTGDPGMLEKCVVQIGRIYTWLIRKALWLMWTAVKWFFAFLFKFLMRRE